MLWRWSIRATLLITADERYLDAARAKGRIVALMDWK
jgi:hypothetical protein